MRTLKSGRTVDDYEDVIDIAIHTHCPSKWRFVDLETGDVWEYHPKPTPGLGWGTIKSGSFMRARDMKEIRDVLEVR